MSDIFMGTSEEYNPITEEQTEFVPQEIQTEETPIDIQPTPTEEQEIERRAPVIARTYNLGRVAPVWKGEYDDEAIYDVLDVIRFDYGVYCCLIENLKGIAPVSGESTAYWVMVIPPNAQQGPQGVQGPAGEVGSQGIQGATGSQGLQGAVGLQGIQGLQGSAGRDGRDGIDGMDGQDGTNGKDGKDGKDGRDGQDGQDGVQGAIGSQGLQGIQGPQGLVGLSGCDGYDGAQGATGSQGATGLQGIQGPAGQNGVNGQDGTNGQDGKDGSQGIQGLQGTMGIQGPAGQDGTNGQDGQPGAQGAIGSQGLQGATGLQGIQGPAGQNGVNGTNGTNGQDGQPGAQGAIGSQGIQGTTGIQGATGLQGVQGPAGESSSADIVVDISEVTVLNAPTVSNISIVETLEPTLKANIRKSLGRKSYIQTITDDYLDTGLQANQPQCAMFDYGADVSSGQVKAVGDIIEINYTSLSTANEANYDAFYSAIGVTPPTVDGVKKARGVSGAFTFNPFYKSSAPVTANMCFVNKETISMPITFHLYDYSEKLIADSKQRTVNTFGSVKPTIWIHSWPYTSSTSYITKYIFKNLLSGVGIDIVVDLGESNGYTNDPTYSQVIPWVESTTDNNTNSNGTIYLLRGNLSDAICTHIANNRNGATIRCHIEDYDYYSAKFGTSFLKKFDYVIDKGAGIRAIGLAD